MDLCVRGRLSLFLDLVCCLFGARDEMNPSPNPNPNPNPNQVHAKRCAR